MKNKIKILFVVPMLTGGGVERALSTLLSHLNTKKFDMFLLFGRKKGVYLDTRLQQIPTFHLQSKGEGLFALPKEIWTIANIIRREKPRIVFSFLTRANLIVILATKLSRVKTSVIVSERSTLSKVLKARHGVRSFIQRCGVKVLYRYANYITTVSAGVKDDLIKNFGVTADKVITIHNPIDLEQISRLSSEEVDHPWFLNKTPLIITVGQLIPEKGHVYLLKAFVRVRRVIPCKLVILGKGTEKEYLEELAKALGVWDDVAFLGFQKNPFKYVARANVFVLSSFFEGFPNSLVEAMACGTPVIATRCSSGPEEIITDNLNGILVPVADEKTLADAILEILKDNELRERLSRQGKKRAKDFELEKKIKEYEEILEKSAS